jgi:hypothetical protein
MEILSRFSLESTFDEAMWRDAMHRLAHNELSSRQRLVTCQRAIEAAVLLGRPEEALETLGLANRSELLDVNWIDRCPLFRGFVDPRWRAQREILAARAGRVLAALRAAS